MRAEQMELLAKVDFVEAVKLLQNQGLKDAEYSVRERAIWALSQMKSDGAARGRARRASRTATSW